MARIRRASDAEYREKNRDKLRQAARDYSLNNRAAATARNREWRRNNPAHWSALNRASVQRRKIMQTRAMPGWLADSQHGAIAAVYADASSRAGGPWHVDHIIPINGKLVCGLHVPWNLRVLYWRDNVSKGNRVVEAA